MKQKPYPEITALKIYQEKFPTAQVLFLAGSVMRGEGTEYSDLDIVVVYEYVEAAYRDSFIYEGWPIEVFVHDRETLKYFFEKIDGPSGIPSLPNMVFEGSEIPKQTDFSRGIKEKAKVFIESGPVAWTKNDIDRNRYFITDLCDDLRQPRSYHEMVGTLGQLQEALTNFYFRAQGKWSAKGKSIPRKWKQDNPALANEFLNAMENAYKFGDAKLIISFSEKILNSYGGWHFEGFKLEAPIEWRLVES